MNLRILLPSLCLLGMFLLPSCEDFFDINTDPNNPTDVSANLILPAAQQSMAGYFGMATTGLSYIPSIYMHQMVERGTDLNDYGVTGNNFEVEVPWEGLYTATLPDLQQVITKGDANGNRIYAGIARVLKAYTFSLMVDVWGDIPFSEATNGTAVLFPKFDDDAQIYAELFALIDQGLQDLASEAGLRPGADDLFYGGDVSKWIKFANTLKLKLYNQVRLVQDVSAEAQALVNSGALIGPGDDFEMAYGTNVSPDDRNPGYVNEYGSSPTYISPFFYEILKGRSDDNPILNGIEDPRLPYYFYNQLQPGDAAQNPTAYRDGGFVSIYMFSFNIDPNEGFDQDQSQTVAGLYPVGGKYDDGSGGTIGIGSGLGNTPQRFLPYFSALYIRAELALAGVTNEDARSLFEQAMKASFDKVNEVAALGGAPALDTSAVTTYIDNVMNRYDNGSEALKLELIMTEKWIASFGFGIDAYTDYRRTSYPVLFDGNQDDNPNTVRGREFPLSFPYSAENLNLNQNAPAQRQIALDPVFWDN